MKILIIGDSDLLREYLAKAMKMEGHLVNTVDDGPKGLWSATSFDSEVVVPDVMLPGVDGFEVIASLN